MKKIKHLYYFYWIAKRLWEKDKKRLFPLSFGKKIFCWMRGFLPESYVIYDFAKNDPQTFVSDFKRAGNVGSINGKMSILLDEKFIFCNELYWEKRMVQPIAYLKHDNIYDWRTHQPIKREEFDKTFKGEYVVKPSGGGGGFDIFFIKNSEELTMEGKPTNWNEITQRIVGTRRALIYERIVQTGFASKINNNSLNTIRILTMNDPKTGKSFIASSVLRCGTKKSGNVDNWSNGGLCMKVDIQTGTLSKGVTFPYDGKLEWHSRHPDSNFQLEDFVIPDWHSISSEVLRLADILYYVPYIGWDIIPMENDFLILEGNSNSDVNLLQVHGALLKEKKVFDFYKYYQAI